uniref:SFRICE_025479 n=1 Tax=Spodoptera frugiperda TaxID=7108 RepID=A0A2H1W900_SPOFR
MATHCKALGQISRSNLYQLVVRDSYFLSTRNSTSFRPYWGLIFMSSIPRYTTRRQLCSLFILRQTDLLPATSFA